MESLTLTGGINGMSGGMAGAMGSLKGSLNTQKSAVGELLQGGQQASAEIAKSGADLARTNQLQQMGVGQKLDVSA